MNLSQPPPPRPTRNLIAAALLSAAILFPVACVGARCQTLKWTFNNPTPTRAGDYFGYSVAISGNQVLVGDCREDTGATDSGSAYLFDAATGSLVRTLKNPTPFGDDSFGWSVAISGNNVLVGAMQDDTGAVNSGSAYLFDAATGSLLRTFNNPTPSPNNCFSSSVAISGNNILVGAEFDDTVATNAGSAYLFDAATGSLLWTFNNPTPAADDHFGHSVAISGNNVLVGALYDDTGATNSGSAYLFDAATGSLLRTLTNPTPAELDVFGVSVAISGNSVLVGAEFDDTVGTNAGSAYLFDAATGALLRTFNSPTPANEWFGWTVAISGNNVLVGTHLHDDVGAGKGGSAYLFDATTGALLETFNHPTLAAYDNFGGAVAISGNNVLVGAHIDDTRANKGSAFLFACPPIPIPTPRWTP